MRKYLLGAISLVSILVVGCNKNGERLYEVGKHIEPGEYVLVANGINKLVENSDAVYGYYAVCTTKDCNIDPGADIDEIIVNANVTGKAYVILEEGQYLQTNDMKLYSVDEYDSKINNFISYSYELGGSDYYKVGTDLSAGTYTITGKNFYYAICSKPSCDSLNDEIIKNEYIDSEDEVNSTTFILENNQYLVISGTNPFTITKQ